MVGTVAEDQYISTRSNYVAYMTGSVDAGSTRVLTCWQSHFVMVEAVSTEEGQMQKPISTYLLKAPEAEVILNERSPCNSSVLPLSELNKYNVRVVPIVSVSAGSNSTSAAFS